MSETLNRIAPGCSIICVNNVTEGAACTVLLAKEIINNENELMIANTDQWVDIDIDIYLSKLKDEELDGLIMSMTATDPKWSFIGFDEQNKVSQVVEKQVISNEATVGIYNFRRGSDFVIGAENMIKNNERVNGEFYVAPVYNELILDKKRVSYFNIGFENAGMFGLGIPQDLQNFLKNPISLNSVNF
jgi:dTDP-glucose pyrophosphorylase